MFLGAGILSRGGSVIGLAIVIPPIHKNIVNPAAFAVKAFVQAGCCRFALASHGVLANPADVALPKPKRQGSDPYAFCGIAHGRSHIRSHEAAPASACS